MSCCSPHKKHGDEAKQSHSQTESKSSCCKQEEKTHTENSGSSCCSSNSSNNFSNKPKTISREMTIEEILGMFPNKAQRLSQEITNAGLHCVGCHAAVWETLEAGMYTHGKTDDQINELVRRLNALLEEKVEHRSIGMSPRAASKFLEILDEEGKQGWGMRFSEEMAGCNGFEYVLDFSEKAEPDDEVYTSQGIEIHVKKAMCARLENSWIDWAEGLRGSGFKVDNPNVRSSCGCGTSHNY